MSKIIAEHEVTDAAGKTAVDSLQFLVTPQLVLIGANLAADAILQKGDALKLIDGRVVAVDPKLEAPMMELVSNASQKGYRALFVGLGSRSDITWAASAKTLLAASSAPPAVLISVRPLVKSDPLSGPDLGALFHLTPAEARLAVDLAAGHSLTDISASRGVHISTLRAQLRSIFTKTGVSKQAEFVSAIWRAASV